MIGLGPVGWSWAGFRVDLGSRNFLSFFGPSGAATLGGLTETFSALLFRRSRDLSNVPRVRAVVGLRRRLLHGYVKQVVARVPVQVRRQSGNAVANGRDTQSQSLRRSVHCGRRGLLNLCMGWLLLSALLMQRSSTMVEPALMPTPLLLDDPISARGFNVTLSVDAREKSRTCSRRSMVMC